MAVAGLVTVGTLSFSCTPRPVQYSAVVGTVLPASDSLVLSSPVQGLFCQPDRLLTIDELGERIYAVDTGLRQLTTIPLPERIINPRGLVADRFYIWLFTDNGIFRLDRSSGAMIAVARNLRVQSAGVLADGRLGLFDGISRRILLLDGTGRVDVLSLTAPIEPLGLATGADGNFYIIDQFTPQVARVNRIGNLLRSFPLPALCTRMAIDDSLNVWLLERSGRTIWRLPTGKDHPTAQRLVPEVSVGLREIAVNASSIYLLGERRLYRFRRQ